MDFKVYFTFDIQIQRSFVIRLQQILVCKDIKYVHIDGYKSYNDERKIFAQNSHKYLIEQLQVNTISYKPNIQKYDYTNVDEYFEVHRIR